ncbi:fluoride efflux transporter CrcB [Yinghuangia soli]|uniref:Fluoride-specific ion channel FluC n=1 Tax=Yinghuangia soli TaxID=2908204 RepID=A0AA41PVQ7_9ACTN|nr:fluoride efflux transporter CrcB [Yinghuangia soli]MCF2526763.1 fluoride efflux transporter CrcB [Yinghuangia soli]
MPSASGGDEEPVDPDVVLGPAAGTPPVWAVLAVVSAGGALGASARYGAGLLWPTPEVGFPWTTLLVNAAGCAAMGVLMVLVAEVRTAHPLVRPFLGTGVLGGFTTFSTYTVDFQRLVEAGRAGLAVAYLFGTLVLALVCVAAAAWLTRRIAGRAGGTGTEARA